MRLSTLINRTPFGVSNAEMSSQRYGLFGRDRFETVKREQLRKHLDTVAGSVNALEGTLLGVQTSYIEAGGAPDYDGRQAEWWTVISYDGEPIP